MIPFAIIATAGILLSALRTAPVFQAIAEPIVGATLSYVEAILAVVVIEVFVVIGRYSLVVLSAQDGESNIDEVKKWMRYGFRFAFTIAALANLYASVTHLPIVAPVKPILDLVVAILVGLSAPVLAFISADILAVLWARSERRRADLRSKFDTAMTAWFDAREKSWNAKKKDYGLRILVENPVSNSIPAFSNGIPLEALAGNRSEIIPSESTLGHKKAPNARTLAEQWFDGYTGDLNDVDAKAVCSELGIGKSTFYAVWTERRRADLRTEAQS